MASDTPKLTDKQQAFINAYFVCGYNATEAARRAGYSEATARQSGAENLSKPVIRAEINRRFAEQGMEADEALGRLADHARGSVAPFLRIVNGNFDGLNLGDETPLHLIKKITYSKKNDEVKIELHDAQAALKFIIDHTTAKQSDTPLGDDESVAEGLADSLSRFIARHGTGVSATNDNEMDTTPRPASDSLS